MLCGTAEKKIAQQMFYFCAINSLSLHHRDGDTADCVFMIMSGTVEIIRRLEHNVDTDTAINTLDNMEQSFRCVCMCVWLAIVQMCSCAHA